MWKVNIFVLTSLIVLLYYGGQPTQADDGKVSERCSSVERTVKKKVADYIVRISYMDDRTCQRLEILKAKQVVYSEEGIDNHYSFGNDWGDRHDPYLMHLTGHG